MNSIVKHVVNRLIKKKFTLATAESCTGGMLSEKITSVSGSSKAFSHGFVTYSNKSKILLLNINKNAIKKYGAVSKEICLLMLKNLNKKIKSNISIAITGIAGPSGGTKTKPVGLVYIGIKKGNKIIVKKNIFIKRDRIQIQKAATNESLKLILSFLK